MWRISQLHCDYYYILHHCELTKLDEHTNEIILESRMIHLVGDVAKSYLDVLQCQQLSVLPCVHPFQLGMGKGQSFKLP